MAKDDTRSKLATVVACLITIAWTTSFSLDLFMEGYDPPASVTPLMLATAGYLFGGEVVAKVRKPVEPETDTS